MPQPRLLEHAPIREAVVDIRIPLQPPESLPVLEEMANRLDYPEVHAGFEFKGQFAFGADGGVPQGHESRANGFRAVSETRVVQFRLNGLGVSRLEPYVSWAELLETAQDIWGPYREALEPTQATRLGLRYINNVRVPYPVADLRDYFLGLPDHPPEWPQATSSFLFRRTLHDETSGASVHITHALTDDVDDDRVGVIFDIDAYVEGMFEVDEQAIWGTFGKLRHLKNRIFFSGITERALQLFE